MRLTVFVILSFVSGAISCFGQRKLEIQFLVSPTFSSRYLAANSKDFVKAFNELEKGMISFDAGVLAVPFKKHRLTIGTGLVYSRKGFVWADFMGRDIDGGQTVHIKVKEVLHFLEIPIRLTYSLQKVRNSYLVVGLLNDILINSDIQLSNLAFNPYAYEKRRYNVGINLGVGYEVRISNSLFIGIEPNVKFQSMPYLDKRTSAQRYLYTAGLSIVTKLTK